MTFIRAFLFPDLSILTLLLVALAAYSSDKTIITASRHSGPTVSYLGRLWRRAHAEVINTLNEILILPMDKAGHFVRVAAPAEEHPQVDFNVCIVALL